MVDEPRPRKRRRQTQDTLNYDEIKQQRRNLPVYRIRGELMQVFKMEKVMIFVGETACGKTTQIPQYVLSGGFAKDLAIAVTQPRRVAAITIAERVATELGTELGDKVGYSVRFDDMTSSSTKIKYVTDGMLLRESISDPLLSSYSWVILDEAHERTIHTDVLFGIVKSAQRTRKEENHPPLQIIVMSATIDEDKLSKYFEGAPIYNLPGHYYSITIFNSQTDEDNYAACALSTVFHIHQNEPDGDILVFMTGEEEIGSMVAETAKVALEILDNGMKLIPCALYDSLPSHLLRPSPPNTRKVIYSTNIAETSLTIPSVKYVIDTGVVKLKFFNLASGLDLHRIQRISKAQAKLRLDRAGRGHEGACYRLYTKEEFETFNEFLTPEIQRCRLSSIVLQIIAIGISDIRTFDFLDKPSDENINAAIKQLVLLGAVEEEDDGNLRLTKCGEQMVRFPLDPRFSKIIITSPKFKCTDEILTIISLLCAEPLFLGSPNVRDSVFKLRKRFGSGEGDHVLLLELYRVFRSSEFPQGWCILHHMSYKAMTKAVFIREQLGQICQKAGIPSCSCGDEDTFLIRRCLTTGLFMNSARLYQNETYKMIGSSRKAYVHSTSSLFRCKTPYCIYTHLIKSSNKYYLRNVSVVEQDWLLEAAPEYFATHGL